MLSHRSELSGNQTQLNEVNCLKSNKTLRSHVYIFRGNFDTISKPEIGLELCTSPLGPFYEVGLLCLLSIPQEMFN